MRGINIFILCLVSHLCFTQEQNTIKEYPIYYKRLTNPISIANTTKIYASPDTTSQVLTTLDFSSPLVPISNCRLNNWLSLQWSGDTTYVKKTDISLFSFPSSKNEDVLYFITEYKQSSVIYKYHLAKKQFLDSIIVERIIPDRVEYIDSKKWGNTELIIGLNHDGHCCGCSDRQIYIMDANNHFEKIFETSQFMGDGELREEYTSSLIFPEDPTIESILFKEYEFLENKEKSAEIKYRWNGEELIEE